MALFPDIESFLVATGGGGGAAAEGVAIWSPTRTYIDGQIVIGSDGEDYSSLESGNLDNDPTQTVLSLSTAVFSGNSFSFTPQDSQPSGIHFSSDGFIMIMVGFSSDSVHRYDLSTAFDITTASFLNSFNVFAQDANPIGVHLSPDGTKMFIMGNLSDFVHRYDLSTPFDITTSVFLNSFSVGPQGAFPQSVYFSPDGTKMFTTEDTSKDVHRYDLTTPFDLTTISFLNSFSVALQDGSPTDAFITSDGLIMMVVGNDTNSVYRYILSIPFDITTAIIFDSFSVAAQDTTPVSIDFPADGKIMFMLGDNSNSVFKYDLPPAWAKILNEENFTGVESVTGPTVDNTDPANPVIADASTVLTLEFANLNARFFGELGLHTEQGFTTAGILGSTSIVSDSVFGETKDVQNFVTNATPPGGATRTLVLSDIQNLVNFGGEFSTTLRGPIAGQTNLVNLQFGIRGVDSPFGGPDRRIAFLVSGDGAEYSINPVGSGLPTGNFGLGVDPSEYVTIAIRILPNPAAIALTDLAGEVFANGILVRTFTSLFQTVISKGTRIEAEMFSTDRQINVDNFGLTIFEESNIKTLSVDDLSNNKVAVIIPVGIRDYTIISSDTTDRGIGDEIEVVSQNVGGTVRLRTEDLALPKTLFNGVNDVTNATAAVNTLLLVNLIAQGSVYISEGEASIPSLSVDFLDDTVRPAFDIQGAAFTVSTSVGTEDGNPSGMAYSTDGLKMFVSGQVNDRIFEYDLGTAFDPTTKVFNGVFLSLIGQQTSPTGVQISTDGSTLFVIGTQNTRLSQINLPTANSLTGATFTQFISVGAQDGSPQDISLKVDGSGIYFVGISNDLVFLLNMPTPNSLTGATIDPFTLDVSNEDGAALGMDVSPDGTTLIIVGNSSDAAHQYRLPNPGSLQGASFTGKSFDVSGQDGSPVGATFRKDTGAEMFMVGDINNSIFTYKIADTEAEIIASMQTEFSIPNGIFILAYTFLGVNKISSVIFVGGVGTIDSSRDILPDSTLNINEGLTYINNGGSWRIGGAAPFVDFIVENGGQPIVIPAGTSVFLNSSAVVFDGDIDLNTIGRATILLSDGVGGSKRYHQAGFQDDSMQKGDGTVGRPGASNFQFSNGSRDRQEVKTSGGGVDLHSVYRTGETDLDPGPSGVNIFRVLGSSPDGVTKDATTALVAGIPIDNNTANEVTVREARITFDAITATPISP